MTQLSLPGVPTRPTAADLKALVRRRMVGFALHQQLRQDRRARRRAQAIRAEYRRKAAVCP